MERFTGQDLGGAPEIAVVANDALGNFVVSTPLLQMLRFTYPACAITYFGGRRTEELEASSDLIDNHFPLHGESLDSAAAFASERGPFDWLINLETGPHARSFSGLVDAAYTTGPCSVAGQDVPFPDDRRGDLWRDQNWIDPQIAQAYPFLDSGFIGEIFCRLCYLEGRVPRYRVPSALPPRTCDILIAMSASLPDKLWSLEGWTAAVELLTNRGLSVGLLGAKPSAQSSFWLGSQEESEILGTGLVDDLRGTMSLPQVVGALAAAQLVLTLDNGILHLAVSGGAPVIGLYREGIHRLWAPPFNNLIPLIADIASPVSTIEFSKVQGAVLGVFEA